MLELPVTSTDPDKLPPIPLEPLYDLVDLQAFFSG
jgi:hypothetical protein